MVREDRGNDPIKLPLEGRTLLFALIACASVVHGVRAELTTTIPVAPEPVGSGARALGQSAFLAVADDATAASWNPAGLTNLERPEASFVGAWKTTWGDPSSNSDTSYDTQSWRQGEINFMSYAQPLRIGDTDAVLSVNYHQVYDLGMKLSYAISGDDPHTVKDISRGAISAYSLACGLSMPSCPAITIGASFNCYSGSLSNDYARKVKQTTWSDSNDWLITRETINEPHGYNFTFGLLWDVYEKQENLLTLGLVCHTPFTIDADMELVGISNGQMNYPVQHLDIDLPLSLGAGVNYRFSDEFSTAFDVQWTDWSDYSMEFTGGTSAPDDTVAVRLGFERLWFSEFGQNSAYALRGGVFYEPRPAWSDILPVYGFSGGLGWTLKERLSLDFAYQYRWGHGENFTVGEDKFDYGIREHLLIGSVIVYVP